MYKTKKEISIEKKIPGNFHRKENSWKFPTAIDRNLFYLISFPFFSHHKLITFQPMTSTKTKVFIPRELGWWSSYKDGTTEYEAYQHSRQPHPPLLRKCHTLAQWKSGGGMWLGGFSTYIDYYSQWCSIYDECVKWSHLHRSSDEEWNKLEETYGPHGKAWLVFDDQLEHMDAEDLETYIYFPVAVCTVCDRIEGVCKLCSTLHYKKFTFSSP